jgi:hypothetical protein
MNLLLIASTVALTLSQSTFAQGINSHSIGRKFFSSDELYVKVRDVTNEYSARRPSVFPTPVKGALPGTKPAPTPAYPGGFVPPTNPSTTPSIPPAVDPLPPFPGVGGTTTPGGTPTTTTPYPTYPGTGEPGVLNGGAKVTLGDIVTLGQKVWDFVVNNKPTTTYQTLKASVVPSGITSWTQLRGWSRPVSKVYRVEFTNIYGGSAGHFDYRITFIYGGNYAGKGKYIGQISFVPADVQLHTDRSLDVKAELLDALNFGTEEDPIAGAQLEITWSSPTTTRYKMNSVDLFLYGTGEIQNLTDGI